MASVTIQCAAEDAVLLNDFGPEAFAALCIVSEAKLEAGAESTTITAAKSTHEKCQRCWNYWPSVGKDAEHADLCERCAAVVDRP